MDKDTQLWNEYQNLKDEIKSADSLNYQIIGLIVGAVAAILTTGFSQADAIFRSFIFLCVYIVTIPGYKLLQGNRRRVWRISTYIRIFLEPQFDFIKWETRLNIQRQLANMDRDRQSISTLVGANEWLVVSILNIVTAFALIFTGLILIKTSYYIRIIGIVFVVILNLWIVITTSHYEKELRRLGKVEENYLKSWREVHKRESKK